MQTIWEMKHHSTSEKALALKQTKAQIKLGQHKTQLRHHQCRALFWWNMHPIGSEGPPLKQPCRSAIWMEMALHHTEEPIHVNTYKVLKAFINRLRSVFKWTNLVSTTGSTINLVSVSTAISQTLGPTA